MLTKINLVLLLTAIVLVNSEFASETHKCCKFYKELSVFETLLSNFRMKFSRLNVTTDYFNSTDTSCEETTLTLNSFDFKNSFKSKKNKTDLILSVYKAGKSLKLFFNLFNFQLLQT